MVGADAMRRKSDAGMKNFTRPLMLLLCPRMLPGKEGISKHRQQRVAGPKKRKKEGQPTPFHGLG